MNDRFGFAVVGTGMAAAPHARALQALSEKAKVIGVYSRTAGRRERFASEFGFPAIASVESLAQDPSVDAAIIITPPNARADLVKLFAENGKHILCEKPLERTVGAAEELAEICRSSNVELGIVFQHRFRAASRRLAALLADGVLGEIRVARAEIPWWRDQAYYDEPGRGTLARDGGGVLISQAIHALDLMLSFTGPVREVQALTATTAFHSMESEDFACAGLNFANGAVGAVVATTAAFPGEAESISLECDKASAVLKAGVLTVRWRVGGAETFGAEAETGAGADPMAFPFDWHRDLIESFLDRVNSGEAPEASGADSIAVQHLIAAMIRSSAQGCRVALPAID